MIEHFIQVANKILDISAHESGLGTRPLPLGYLVVGIILTPVLILILATLLGKPRQPRITSVFLGFMALMALVFIGAVFGLSYLLGIFY